LCCTTAEEAQMTVVVFTVPPGVRAGQQIVVQAPNGQRVTVQLPPNTLPGQRMQVSVPDSSQPSQQTPSPGAGTGGGIAGSSGMGSAPQHGTSLFEFVVPPHAQPHQRLMVQVPSGQRVNVQLPAGAAPGMRMRVAVPTASSSHTSLPPMDAVAKLLGDRGEGFGNKVIRLRQIVEKHKSNSATNPAPQHLVMNVRRDRILEDTLWHFLKPPLNNPAQLRQKPFQIKFVSEDGIDQGGLTREFYTVLTHGFVDPSPALFTHSAVDDYTYQINPLSGVNPEHLEYFELLGKVMAKSIFDGVQLDVHFSSAFYKSLLDIPLRFDDLEKVDTELHKSLLYLRDTEIDPLCLCIFFTVSYDEFGVVRDVELKEGGKDIEVTDANKEEFIRLKMKWRLEDRVAEQRDAVRKGFFQVMAKEELAALDLDDRELELILCGIPKIDVDDWRKNTAYKSGYKEGDQVIKLFWEVLSEWDDELRSAVLRFATGTPKVPVEGFGALKGSGGPKLFTIQKVKWDLTRLPQAATCFNTLYLPPYETADQLKEKLEFAVTEAAEGFGLK